MFTVRTVVRPRTIEEAYMILLQRRTNALLGGCAFLKLGSQHIDTAIDLAGLGLNFVRELDGFVEIGAMTSLRTLEMHPLLTRHFAGLLTQATRNIIGVQFRNSATVGGSVYAKYGFSDVLTALLAVNAEVVLYKSGRLKLAEFLSRPAERDILTSIFIAKDNFPAAYQSVRNSASDFPILNVAVARQGEQWRIAVGARPGRAQLAEAAAAVLDAKPSEQSVREAAKIAANELTFGSNSRGTAAYRQAICQTLVRRAIREAVQCL